MRNFSTKVAAVLLLSVGVFFAVPASAQSNNTPVGLWKTIDDASGEAKSYVQIWKDGNGVLHGKITKLLGRDDADTVVCDVCTGSRKDQLVQGMKILSSFTQKKADDPTFWTDGKILDPGNGKEYSCNLIVQDGGKKLKVRGYVGLPAFGRTQYWYRMK